ncbi:MAG: DNA/RNA non-specific endonuclease [Rikenellaceae bacterium]
MKVKIYSLLALIAVVIIGCRYYPDISTEDSDDNSTEDDTEQISGVDEAESVEVEDSQEVLTAWYELPASNNDSRYQYVTHYTQLDSGVDVRNFSLCYDTKSAGAAWIAYPYHEIYDGDSGRSSSWSSDPLIDDELQPYLKSSYPNSLYDRGHQIPSADRQATSDMNKQTFYYSNSTPQLARLNQQKWASLEEQVRNQVCSDTLYVVTGAHYLNSTQTTSDSAGKEVAIPTAYFKVLLRTRSGSSGRSIGECDDSELKSIGFWVEHQYYSTLPAPVSVEQIEELSGFTLFPHVSKSVKQQANIEDWSLSKSLFEL